MCARTTRRPSSTANHGEHFGGGAFAFHDAAADVKLAPRGRCSRFRAAPRICARSRPSSGAAASRSRAVRPTRACHRPRRRAAVAAARGVVLARRRERIALGRDPALASNDGARARLLAAHARGTPLLRELAEMGDEGAGRRPPPGAGSDRHGGGGGGGWCGRRAAAAGEGAEAARGRGWRRSSGSEGAEARASRRRSRCLTRIEFCRAARAAVGRRDAV